MDVPAYFCVLNGLISDGSTHSKTDTLGVVGKGLRVPQNFHIPYSPQSSYAIECLEKELLHNFCAVISELFLRPDECLNFRALAQRAINNDPSPKRTNVPHIKAMTGIGASALILAFYCVNAFEPVTSIDAVREPVLSVLRLNDLVSKLHHFFQDLLQ